MHGIPHIFNMSYINFLHKLQLQRTINKYIINNIYNIKLNNINYKIINFINIYNLFKNNLIKIIFIINKT